MKAIRRTISWVAVGLLIASVVQELRKPADERTWHGTIASVFPYDLRVPTMDRVRDAFWNPNDPRVVVPTVFGVGWSVNVHALLARIGASE